MAFEDFPIGTPVVASGEIDGIPWVAARAPRYGAVNGYVRVPDNHPWLDVTDYIDIECIETEVPWGGFTYHKGNWFGFDSMHAGQWWPAEAEIFSHGPYEGDIIMNDDMVVEWTKQRAREAAAVIFNGSYSI